MSVICARACVRAGVRACVFRNDVNSQTIFPTYIANSSIFFFGYNRNYYYYYSPKKQKSQLDANKII